MSWFEKNKSDWTRSSTLAGSGLGEVIRSVVLDGFWLIFSRREAHRLAG